jgi:hypothetical protein
MVIVLLGLGRLESREVNGIELLVNEALALLAQEGKIIQARVWF